MKRRTITIVTCALFALGVGCGNTSKEPSANGRPLRAWVVLYASTGEETPRHKDAEEAIREIGTNALPFLLQYIADGSPRLPGEVAGPRNSHTLAMAAPAAFTILSSTAKPTVQPLSAMLTNWNPNVSPLAAHALGRMRVTGLNALIAALSAANANVRRCAAEAMIFAGTNAVTALPSLRNATNDSSAEVREAATMMIEVLEQHSRKDPSAS